MKYRRTVISLLLLVMGASSEAQESTKKPIAAHKQMNSPATISGRVFAITKGGDLQPARMAKIFLMYLSDKEEPLALDAQTPGVVFDSYYMAREKQALLEQKQNARKYAGSATLDDLQCRVEMHAIASALTGTLDWVEKNKKTSEVVAMEADEEGQFRIKAPAGYYVLKALGQAGMNDAYWTTPVLLKAGQTLSLKLSAPETACFNEP